MAVDDAPTVVLTRPTSPSSASVDKHCPLCRSSTREVRYGSRVLLWPSVPITRCKDAWHDMEPVR
jgi:hypothetical protein